MTRQITIARVNNQFYRRCLTAGHGYIHAVSKRSVVLKPAVIGDYLLAT
jgi:hypothetical protein